jgi:hypothetical protein
MKLLFCKSCQDVIRLIDTERSCRCGSTRGRYVNETLAVYSGADAVPIGFANRSFARAVRSQPRSGNGLVFEAFVIAAECDTFERE